MNFKSALVGCGGRAVGHVSAYEHVKRAKLAAVCDIFPDKVASFGDRFGIAGRYTDLDEMLAKEKPDLLHAVTAPNHRLDVLGAADRHNVPAVIIEKPVALEGEDFNVLKQLSETTKTKICVNHQLHFHPRRLELAKRVADGEIGEVRMIEGTARLNLSGQGTHVLQLIHGMNPGTRATEVFGNVSGARELNSNSTHAAPDESEATIAFANGVRAQFICGRNAPRVTDAPEHMHKRIAVYGTRGFVHWTMHSWERTTPTGIESGAHQYGEQDVLGQAGLTEAMCDWIEDDAKVHPTNLADSLAQFNIILGLYMSALNHTVIELPVEPQAGLIAALKARLSG